MSRKFNQHFINELIDYANELHDIKLPYPRYVNNKDLIIQDKVKILDSYPKDGALLFKIYNDEAGEIFYRKWYFLDDRGGGAGMAITEEYFNSFT